ncbi:MAG: hypothetical protein AAFU54_18905 [Chloroflexota bacterium]
MSENQTRVGVIESGDGTESFRYIEVSDLEAMTLEEAEAILDLVPTEDIDFLNKRYRRLVKKHEVGSDEQEIQLTDEYLNRYQFEGLVPAGEQWVRLSSAKRLDMKSGETDVNDYDEDDSEGIPWGNVAIVGFGIFLVVFVLFRVLGGDDSEASVVLEATPTATPTATATFTPSPIPTITPTPTPTPIALVESDRFIEAGDGRNRNFFPVQFQISRPDDTQPRVFIVQERAVELTEWQFDPNPDVVSWISQTSIRPVLGIPFSQANDAFIRSLGPGTVFTMRMNTGSELSFSFSSAAEVGRQDTTLFQQIEPGIVLVLIGELGDDNLPTPTRYIVTASYNPGNEVDLSGFNGVPANVGDVVRMPPVTITIEDSYIVPVSGSSSGDFMYAVVDMTVTALDEDVQLSTFQWFLDVDESRYSPDLSLSSGMTYANLPPVLSAGQAVQASTAFLVSRFDGDGLFLFAPPGQVAERVLVPFNLPPVPSTVEGLDVQLRRISRNGSNVFVDVRVYNPQAEAVTLELNDIGVIFGFTRNPSGPTSRPVDYEPVLFEPEFALDLTFTFDWNADDPFATLTVAGRVWSIQLVE